MTNETEPDIRRRFHSHQIRALVLTFFTYAAFHAARKPPSITKPSLHATWPPFTGPTTGPHRLGELDVSFLSSYSFSMFFSGAAADRFPLRPLLSLSCFLSSLAAALFATAFFVEIHSFTYFVMVQLVSGVFHSAAWPCVVAVVANWFGNSNKKGLIMGAWNSHTSVGNIMGSVVAASVLDFGWGWSFLLPGVLLLVVGVVLVVFLVAHPKDAGFDCTVIEMDVAETGESVTEEREEEGENAGLLKDEAAKESETIEEEKAIGFLEAWQLPGVAPFAFCLFFSKLVAYTFLYWLPFYIRQTAVAGIKISHRSAGIYSTIFDVGGVLGGISAGYMSDTLDARAVTSILFLFLSVPSLILYRTYGSISMYYNTGLMFLSGFFVNGPYSLITTAVATDLGTQELIKGNSRALATVTAIIDGTGSVGAALGPLLTGYISTRGWNSVFFMLILANSLAIVCLIHIAKAEVTRLRQH